MSLEWEAINTYPEREIAAAIRRAASDRTLPVPNQFTFLSTRTGLVVTVNFNLTMSMSFTAALTKFFGRKEGQTLGEFSVELKALTHKDKLDLVAPLSAALGTPVDPPAPPAA